ncbi:major facilitator superfamily domain-containing protein [Hypoxylon sp. FL1284]|nr:major facilitator superfamily domain-containing protein [Hypoxylon sp. FL1284]
MIMATPSEGEDMNGHSTQATDQINNNHRDRDSEKGEETSQEPNEEAKDKSRSIRGVPWLLICIAIYTTSFLYGLDTTIAADVQGPIVEALGHADQLAWVGAGFPMGSVCVLLFLGKLYNAFNTKWNLITTVVLFEIGSAICGSAPTMNAMIIGRVVAGIGGSGIYLGSLQYMALMTGEKERGFYISLIGALWGVGSVLGPVVGGAFAESPATWRWAFYINLPIGALTIPAFLLYLPAFHPSQGLTIRERLATIDLVGFLLNCGTWISFLLALTMANGAWPWDDGRTIAIFVVFGVVLVAFVLQQYFALFTTPARRLFPGHLLRDRTQVLLYIVTSAGSTTNFVIIYYIPIYFQFVNGDGAVMAAVRLLPFVCIAVAVSISAGSFLHLIKVYMVLYLIGGAFAMAGGGPLTVYLDPSSSTGVIYGLTIIEAVGCGLTMTSAFTVATLTVKPEDVGASLNMQNYGQIGAQVISLAVAGQIYQSVGVRNLSEVLAGHGYAYSEIKDAVVGAQSALFSSLSGELRDRAIMAVAEAMQSTMVMVPVAGGVMFLTALCMKREKLFT